MQLKVFHTEQLCTRGVCVCVNWVLGIVAFRLKFRSLNMNSNPNPVT